MKRLGFNNKYLKQQHELMISFGYELVGRRNRHGGHPLYEREGFDRLELSSTPRSERNARRALMQTLRKRHPEHPMWRSMKKRRRRQRSASSRRPSAVLRLAPVPVPVRKRTRLGSRPACTSCGRPWLSDLDYEHRPCPSCGGRVSLETAA